MTMRKMSVRTTDDQAIGDGDCTHALRTSRRPLHLASGGGHAHFRSLDSRRFAAGGGDSFVATQKSALARLRRTEPETLPFLERTRLPKEDSLASIRGQVCEKDHLIYLIFQLRLCRAPNFIRDLRTHATTWDVCESVPADCSRHQEIKKKEVSICAGELLV